MCRAPDDDTDAKPDFSEGDHCMSSTDWGECDETDWGDVV
jgi:hypothetical protein